MRKDLEFELLTTCVGREHADARRLAQSSAASILDWNKVYALAQRHRITALLNHGLKRNGIDPPRGIATRLSVVARNSALQELALVGELHRLIESLRAVDIEPTVLKGPAVSMLAYGRLGLRHNRDLDLLVAETEVFPALCVLKECGYEVAAGEPQIPDLSLHTRKDLVLYHAGSGVIVELHWRLFNSADLSGHFQEPKCHVALPGGLVTKTLSPDDNLRFLCFHGAEHAWSRLKWLIDVHVLISKRPLDDLTRLYEAARSEQLNRPIAQAMLLRHALFASPVPAIINVDCRRDVCIRLLYQAALHTLRRSGTLEIEDLRFGSTVKTISHYLVSPRGGYLREQICYDLYLGSTGPRPTSVAAMGKVLFHRVLEWLRRQLSG